MFVYKIEKKNIFPIRILIPFYIYKFRYIFLKKFNIYFDVNIDYKEDEIEISFVDYSYSGLDWMPQFTFKIYKKTNSIYLSAIKLPYSIQKTGIGTFCVDWLKNFAKTFSFDCIFLGSYPCAYGFWSKMNFEKVPYQDQILYFSCN
ncbi:GNAT family N-acetyltransferase [Alkalithermobacter paradoxus]|uniref:N-acetyltransferase domain-containing protein n=1 Tax=Alkalithermobacter paradoxus TaxID=29349 RepID=A0A1V4IAM4_9FIRM|nr:hypothetical protein CLOTH_03230 [[Clostridium] thermoalcaliphilum]